MHTHTHYESRSRRGACRSTNYLLHPLHLLRMASRCGAWRNGSRGSSCYMACYKWAGRSVTEGGGTWETIARGRGVYTVVVGMGGHMITIFDIIGSDFERGWQAVVGVTRGVGRLAMRAAKAAAGRRAEPPTRKAIRTAGGLLSTAGQLRFGIAVGKTVAWANPRRIEAA